jgi:hypothetical protein
LGFVIHSGKYRIESAVSFLGLPAVSLDPRGHQVEYLCLEVPRAALRILTAAHQPSIFQHLEVFRHSLNRDIVRGGQLAHRGIPDS